MLKIPSFKLAAIAFLAAIAMTISGAPSALAMKKMVVGPVAFDVPDDFKQAAGGAPAIHQDASSITVEVAELPTMALQEFKGPAFLEFLGTLKYTNAAYADGALKREGPYTYVLADAKGDNGPQSRFLLVIGGEGRAAIVTAYAPKSEIDSGRASRAAIEAILSSATVVPGAAKQ